MSAQCPLCHVPVLGVQPLDATADHGFVQPLTIHLFGFNLLSGWIRGVAVKWSCATQRKAKASDIGFGLLADTLVSALGGFALDHKPAFNALCASKLLVVPASQLVLLQRLSRLLPAEEKPDHWHRVLLRMCREQPSGR